MTMLWVILIQRKMELQLSTEQQQKLISLYQSFGAHTNEITIQMNKGKIEVKCNNIQTSFIVPAKPTSKKRKIDQYVEEAYNADIDLDMTVNNEENIENLLQFIQDPTQSNGQKLLAYSKFWTNCNKKRKVEGLSVKTLKSEISSITTRNIDRLMRIAKRSHEVMEVVGEFFPRKFEIITPTWLLNANNADFESFLERTTVRYRLGIEHLAGARS
jgi:hypothetical protein